MEEDEAGRLRRFRRRFGRGFDVEAVNEDVDEGGGSDGMEVSEGCAILLAEACRFELTLRVLDITLLHVLVRNRTLFH